MKLALITGAGGGIGKELAALFEKKKIPCLLKGKKECDLATTDGRHLLLEEIRLKKPDCVINNAGFGIYGDAVFGDLEEQKAIVAVNAEAVMESTLVAAKMMIESGQKGTILNVSSVGGEIPTPGMAIYGATKAFVTSFSKALDFECAPHGVRVLVSLPGMVATPFAQKAAKKKLPPQKGAIDPKLVAKEILWQIEKGKRVHVIDYRYRAMLILVKHFCLENVGMNAIYDAIRKRL